MDRQQLEGAATARTVNDPVVDERFGRRLDDTFTTALPSSPTPQAAGDQSAWISLGTASLDALRRVAEGWA